MLLGRSLKRNKKDLPKFINFGKSSILEFSINYLS